jgi:hypothetical protein
MSDLVEKLCASLFESYGGKANNLLFDALNVLRKGNFPCSYGFEKGRNRIWGQSYSGRGCSHFRWKEMLDFKPRRFD